MTERAAQVARFARAFLTWVKDVGSDQRVLVRPTPASRPRVCKYGTYYTGAYAHFLRDAPAAFADALAQLGRHEGPVAMLVEHVAKRPKTGTLPSPQGDIDNHTKATLDAIQKAAVLFHDDRQIDVLLAVKRYADPEIDEEEHVRVATFALDAVAPAGSADP